ncbi:MAG: ATP-binding cassette domain-containing protein [Candidatus Hydrogenedentota bacterium]|uniref:Oligopeptide transport ATP-binding protein OppF n=1 Tax=Sumerlaea chitinivorans TaxID=2250252 RepID=A0A2Z4Y534_SUMC1|nr:Oligopeptide transport ATP-binding protein OppF [Candidatus Sumerlaea chitinivorans]RMH28278.1 MAG: ATP-binding cassette domain-containing protein [Candidatus Hydrogenedentota bacterium]GIX45676.1 MAG: ABC transporter ATP-binding protein [Candidatus Sumerlaea sp.]
MSVSAIVGEKQNPRQSAPANNSILRVEGLSVSFPIGRTFWGRPKAWLHAVRDVSLTVAQRETLALVGESGCGKTTLARAILQLIRPQKGAVYLGNSPNLVELTNRQLRPYRRQMQMIFQDPFSSLNPRMTVGSILSEPLIIHRLARGAERRARVHELLREVGLDPTSVNRFPHEFSGGQRQRIGIARALAVEPRIIIADEPVSALDVSIRSQIINLLARLQEERGLSYLFISHDLSVVHHLSHRVMVMYLGAVVEEASTRDLFAEPLHPYTEALLAAVPRPDPKTRTQKLILGGDVPSPVAPPTGCPFHPRCPRRFSPCESIVPELREVAAGRRVACHLHDPAYQSRA